MAVQVCMRSKRVGLGLMCLLFVVLEASSSCAARLLNTTRPETAASIARTHQKLRRQLVENGLGRTPPMGYHYL